MEDFCIFFYDLYTVQVYAPVCVDPSKMIGPKAKNKIAEIYTLNLKCQN